MTVIQKNISGMVNEEYRDYSKYVLYNRAIPSMIDGFKPTARKIFYVMLREGKNLQKVSSINGSVIKNANYHHGDCSGTVIDMTKDFVGSNNIPWFLKKGNFGSKYMPNAAAAARYIFAKFNPLMHYIYKDMDICPKNSDIENPEPEYYLPIIPMLLVNGANGIAIGHATEIQPRNIHDIIKQVKRVLNNEEVEYILPYFKGYQGTIEKDEEGVFAYGQFSIHSNKQITIDELPLKWNRVSFAKAIHKLQDKGIVTSFKDDSKKGQWNIKIRTKNTMNMEEDAWHVFKLIQKLSENITVLNSNNQIVKYENVEDLIEHFTCFRLDWFEKRRLNEIRKIRERIDLLESKIRFVKYLDDVRNHSKKELVKILKADDFTQEQINFCMTLHVYKFSEDEMQKTRDEILALVEKLKWYNNITAKELYLMDLEELEEELKKGKI